MIVYAYDWGCCDDVASALCAGSDIQKICAHVITDHGCCVLAISQPSPTGLDETMSKPQAAPLELQHTTACERAESRVRRNIYHTALLHGTRREVMTATTARPCP